MPNVNDLPLLIFDCDGTLVDSELLGHIAMARCLGTVGITEDAASLLSRYRGGRLANIIADLEMRHKHRFASEFSEYYRATVTDLLELNLRPTPGIDQALRRIPNHKCVASSGPVSKITQSLRLANLSGFFLGSIYSSYVVNSWKPEPGLFLYAASEEGFAPDNCIVIEDSALGVEAARRAGMRCLRYDPDNSYPQSLMADALTFTNMSLLPELVKGTR
jgi:HAD superfamily hydrolase (TIGR01509 family)